MLCSYFTTQEKQRKALKIVFTKLFYGIDTVAQLLLKTPSETEYGYIQGVFATLRLLKMHKIAGFCIKKRK